MSRSNKFIKLVLIMIAILSLSACKSEPAPEKIKPAEIVAQENGRNLVILTEKAAQRLDIQTDTIREEQIVQTHTVGGEVVIETNSPNQALVRVSLSAADLAMVDQNAPVLVLPLNADDDDETNGLIAEPDELSDFDDNEDNREALRYYVVKDLQHGLIQGQRLLVEIPMKVDEAARLMVSVSAIIYDLNGQTWVYTNPEPLAFIRYPITVDFIENEIAVLLEGPPAGTIVATVGVAELYGIDTGVGK